MAAMRQAMMKNGERYDAKAVDSAFAAMQSRREGHGSGPPPDAPLIGGCSGGALEEFTMLEYTITAYRSSPAVATAECERADSASLPLDVDPAGRTDAFNPAELLLTAVAACMLKGIERAIPMHKFSLRTAEVRVHGVRQDSPPRMLRVEYELAVDTDESDARLDLLHRNLQKFGTVYNTLAAAVELTGTIRRGHLSSAPAISGAQDPSSQRPKDL